MLIHLRRGYCNVLNKVKVIIVVIKNKKNANATIINFKGVRYNSPKINEISNKNTI